MSSNPTGPDLIDSHGKRGEVIYKFTPPKPTEISDDTPDEYIVQSLDGYGGCMIHGRYGNRWECNAPARALVLHLINRVKDLEAQQARVMGIIDGETAKALTKEQHKDLRRLQNYYADSAMALLDESVDMSKAHHNIARNILDAINAAYAYEAIRNKINEAKAGAQ
jgi:hypothetical protein